MSLQNGFTYRSLTCSVFVLTLIFFSRSSRSSAPRSIKRIRIASSEPMLLTSGGIVVVVGRQSRAGTDLERDWLVSAK